MEPDCSFPGAIHVPKHNQIVLLLILHIVPPVLVVGMEQLVFGDAVHMQNIRLDDIQGLDGGIVAQSQWPVVVGSDQWFPDTGRSSAAGGKRPRPKR